MYTFCRNELPSVSCSHSQEGELLLFHIERSQMRWFEHLPTMSLWGGASGTSNRGEAPGQSQHMLERLYLWAGLGTPFPQQELEEGAGEREVRASLFTLLALQPGPGRAADDG